MKIHISLILGITTALFVLMNNAPAAFSMDDPGFTIKRMVISKDVVDLKPVGVGDFFSAATDKVYCFLEAADIETDMQVSIVWYWSNQEMARVALPIRKGHRWRTYSSKKLLGLKGNWQAELQDSSGIVHSSVSFVVE